MGRMVLLETSLLEKGHSVFLVVDGALTPIEKMESLPISAAIKYPSEPLACES